MKFGICYCYWSKDWEGTDYPQTIARARKCGFDVLEIFYGRLLDMAQTDFGVAKHLEANYYPKPLEIICYHCQQAVEKGIKALIVKYGAKGGNT